ncbi:hypothetical protein N1851_014409 [Merluccius polli]|uniref:Uncharacterized protein n=1 Tax=Merluccius polli TaxID=89951 RepID=A0AA47MTH0_MERPO|nr:hypothetical protein N1851_014409 [Merluccius polli]
MVQRRCCCKAVDQVQQDDSHHTHLIFFTLASHQVVGNTPRTARSIIRTGALVELVLVLSRCRYIDR